MGIKVIGVIVGGQPKEFALEVGATLGDLRTMLNADGYQASVNGEPVDEDSYELAEFEYVSFAAKVKGAAQAKPTKKLVVKGKPVKKGCK